MSNTTATAVTARAGGRSHPRLHRTYKRWLALVALCMAALAPQAFAAACREAPTDAPVTTLTALKWTMVGIPCVPAQVLPGAPANVGNIFLGTANLTAANYANAVSANGWVLWKRNYAVTGDTYSQMLVTDTVTTGGAYWLYTKSGGTFQVNGTATAGTSVSTAYANQKPATNRYIMFANPWTNNPVTKPLNFSALLWSGTIAIGSFTDQSTATVTSNIPFVGALVSTDVSYWNGNTYFTRSLTSSPVATFAPNESAWIKVLPVGANVTNATIKAPKPP